MGIDGLNVIICVVTAIFFRACFISAQIDRSQIKIMNEGGAWRGDCIKYYEIFFKIWKWRLKHFRK